MPNTSTASSTLSLHNSGWLNINKPFGWTSADVVRYLKRRGPKGVKIGHAGTLDPMATGALPIAYGQATKAITYLSHERKVYRFAVVFGISTRTDDQEGTIISISPHRPSQEDIEKVLLQFIGKIEQVPPAHSAIKIAGQRAYALARLQLPVTLPTRQVVIDSFHWLDWIVPQYEALFEVVCSTGTYVRSLARDMARTLGTCGYVSQLHRVAVGPFHTDDANAPEEGWAHSLPLEAAFIAEERLMLTAHQAWKIQQGQSIQLATTQTQGAVLGMVENKPIAFISIEGHYGRPLRVLI